MVGASTGCRAGAGLQRGLWAHADSLPVLTKGPGAQRLVSTQQDGKADARGEHTTHGNARTPREFCKQQVTSTKPGQAPRARSPYAGCVRKSPASPGGRITKLQLSQQPGMFRGTLPASPSQP